jgi:hypothetical protein
MGVKIGRITGSSAAFPGSSGRLRTPPRAPSRLVPPGDTGLVIIFAGYSYIYTTTHTHPTIKESCDFFRTVMRPPTTTTTVPKHPPSPVQGYLTRFSCTCQLYTFKLHFAGAHTHARVCVPTAHICTYYYQRTPHGYNPRPSPSLARALAHAGHVSMPPPIVTTHRPPCRPSLARAWSTCEQMYMSLYICAPTCAPCRRRRRAAHRISHRRPSSCDREAACRAATRRCVYGCG